MRARRCRMRKALVLSVAVGSFLTGAWLSPLVSASNPQDAALLASIPTELRQGQRILFEPKASVACDVIRQSTSWVECKHSTYVNLVSGVSFSIEPDSRK